MTIIGLETEKVTGPDGETTFRLRTALSPYEVEKAAARVGWDALGALAGAAGADRVSALMDGLAGGQEAREAAAEAGIGVSENGDGQDEREDARRAQYDLDWASLRLIKAWSYRNGTAKIPVTLKYVRMLDGKTREWLHVKAWDAMQSSLPEDADTNEGNA